MVTARKARSVLLSLQKNNTHCASYLKVLAASSWIVPFLALSLMTSISLGGASWLLPLSWVSVVCSSAADWAQVCSAAGMRLIVCIKVKKRSTAQTGWLPVGQAGAFVFLTSLLFWTTLMETLFFWANLLIGLGVRSAFAFPPKHYTQHALLQGPQISIEQQKAPADEREQVNTVRVTCHPDSLEVVIKADMFGVGAPVNSDELRLGVEHSDYCRATASSGDEYAIIVGLMDCGTKHWVMVNLLQFAHISSRPLVLNTPSLHRWPRTPWSTRTSSCTLLLPLQMVWFEWRRLWFPLSVITKGLSAFFFFFFFKSLSL